MLQAQSAEMLLCYKSETFQLNKKKLCSMCDLCHQRGLKGITNTKTTSFACKNVFMKFRYGIDQKIFRY